MVLYYGQNAYIKTFFVSIGRNKSPLPHLSPISVIYYSSDIVLKRGVTKILRKYYDHSKELSSS